MDDEEVEDTSMKAFMKDVTLRKLPAKLAKAIRQEAARKGTSINKAVIRLLENRATGRGKNRLAVHDELDSLAGSWSKKETADFDKALAAQRIIDPALWSDGSLGRHFRLSAPDYEKVSQAWSSTSRPRGYTQKS